MVRTELLRAKIAEVAKPAVESDAELGAGKGGPATEEARIPCRSDHNRARHDRNGPDLLSRSGTPRRVSRPTPTVS
jgi:hypothetical protein